jgi:hypothetical protein
VAIVFKALGTYHNIELGLALIFVAAAHLINIRTIPYVDACVVALLK